MEQLEQRDLEFHEEPTDLSQLSDSNSVGSRTELSVEAALQGKPKRYIKIKLWLYISVHGCKSTCISLLKCDFVID